MLFKLDNSIHPYVRLIGRVHYAAAWKHFERTVLEYVLYLMIDGKMSIEENGINYTLTRGDYLLLEPDLPHRGIEAFPCEYYYMHFRHDAIHKTIKSGDDLVNEVLEKRQNSLISYGLSETLPTDTITYVPKTNSLIQNNSCFQFFEMGIAEYAKRLEQYRPALANIACLLLLELSREYTSQLYKASTSKQYTRSMDKTIELVHFLHNNYTRKITGKIIEDELCISFDHLNRTFRRIYGHTIFSYLAQIRINHAKDLIGQTDIKTSEIAYLLGFEDNSYFSKFFKRHTGTTPSQYWKLSHQRDRE